MTQTCKLRNLTQRLVSVPCNSGRARHLPPLASIELNEIEVAKNAFVEKLVMRRIVSLTRAANKVVKKSAAGKDKSRSAKKSAPDLSKQEVGQPPADKAEGKAGDAAEALDETTGAARKRRKSKET